MFLKHFTIIIFFNIALGSRLHQKILNNVEEDFVRLERESGSEDHSFNSSNSQDEDIQYKQTSCGKPSVAPKTFLKIMGGVEANPHSWPWLVSIQLYENDSFDYYCGGSIISATKVISAAHCFFDKKSQLRPITNLYVIAGIHNIKESYSTNSQSKKINSVITHNDYNPNLEGTPFDIAIVYITAPGFIFNEKVQPICLPTSNIPPKISCYAMGWGNIAFNQRNVLHKLYQVKLPILSNSICSQWLGEQFKTSMICAGYAEGGKDTCTGDSGGPLVCKRDGAWVLDGVISWGNDCGQPKEPGVFTRVYDYLSWINSN